MFKTKFVVVRNDLVGDDLFRGAMGYCVYVVSGVRTNDPREKGTHTNFITPYWEGEKNDTLIEERECIHIYISLFAA